MNSNAKDMPRKFLKVIKNNTLISPIILYYFMHFSLGMGRSWCRTFLQDVKETGLEWK
jgi:hypothetical protein